ncbi:hypothetical protein ACHAPB_008707 [Verticillium nonalfalfae]
MVRMLAICFVAAFSTVVFGQFEGWTENQVNASMCLWAQLRGAVIRDTVYLDGGFLYWSQGLSNGEYGPPEQQGRWQCIFTIPAFIDGLSENPLGLMYTPNFSQPFQSSDNFTALFGTISKARGGVGNTNNDAPNYYDGAMLVNSAQLSLYGGLVKKTDAYQPPRADDALTYQAYQYGPKAESDEFMSTVDIYDIANNTWYRQATSDGPTARARACAVVAPAQDQSSFNIYLYGGYPGVDPKVEMNDEVWVLSLPSFTWTRLSEGRPGRGRNGHKCFMPYPDQMMVIGGMTSEAGDHLKCLPDLIQVYNLTSGHWMESYDPERHADYGVPAAVREVIGGGTQEEPS